MRQTIFSRHRDLVQRANVLISQFNAGLVEATESNSALVAALEKLRPETLRRKCVVCDTMHSHNNSYCSAECCKKDRTK